jgi:hypothetical protein
VGRKGGPKGVVEKRVNENSKGSSMVFTKEFNTACHMQLAQLGLREKTEMQ